jgi:hypothetical protein
MKNYNHDNEAQTFEFRVDNGYSEPNYDDFGS